MAGEHLDRLRHGGRCRGGNPRAFGGKQGLDPIQIGERPGAVDYFRQDFALGRRTFLPAAFPRSQACTSAAA